MAEEDTKNEITEETKDKSPMWVTNASDEIAIRFLSDEGAAAETPITVIQAFKNAVDKFGDKVALTSADFKTNLTWRQYYEECRRFAKSLIHLEVQPYESVSKPTLSSFHSFFLQITFYNSDSHQYFLR